MPYINVNNISKEYASKEKFKEKKKLFSPKEEYKLKQIIKTTIKNIE